MSYRILLIDADERNRKMVKDNLSKLRCIIREVGTATQAIELLSQYMFHLVIIDFKIKRNGAFKVLEYMKKENNKSTKLLLTDDNNFDDIVKLYDLGIVDHLVKPLDFDIFNKRIENFIIKKNIGGKHIEFYSDNNCVVIKGHKIKLSKTEFRLFELLVSFPGKVIYREVLENELWYADMDMKIVDVNICNLREKLHTYRGVIVTVRQGYYYEEDNLK